MSLLTSEPSKKKQPNQLTRPQARTFCPGFAFVIRACGAPEIVLQAMRDAGCKMIMRLKIKDCRTQSESVDDVNHPGLDFHPASGIPYRVNGIYLTGAEHAKKG